MLKFKMTVGIFILNKLTYSNGGIIMSHLSERPVYIVDNSDHFLESLPVVPKEELERCEKLADSMMVENIRRKDNGDKEDRS